MVEVVEEGEASYQEEAEAEGEKREVVEEEVSCSEEEEVGDFLYFVILVLSAILFNSG